jgi:thermostable 8-oxoguanine DNA glycosylase
MEAYILETRIGETMTEVVAEKKPVVMSTSKADEFFKTFPKDKIVSYKDYWESVRPQNNDDIFRRYLFAYTSVHTTWQGNVKGYNAIKNFNEWIDSKETLLTKLHKSGVGLHNNRTNYIWDFSQKFWANPKDFYFTTKKYHVKKRDSILNKINGIGLAKISFALEMIHPNEARVLCGDIHQLRLYDVETLKYNKSKVGSSVYKKMERHWMINCGKHKVPSYIARSIYWDNLQNKEDSRYWSFVLEN